MTIAHGTVVSGTGNNGATTSSVTTAASGSSFIIIFCGQGTGTPTISDNKGNTYSLISSASLVSTLGAYDTQIKVYKCVNGVGGSAHTFTASLTNSYCSVFGFEVTGDDVASFEVNSAVVKDTSSPFTDGGFTTTDADTLLISSIIGDSASSSTSFTAGNSFTRQAQTTDGTTHWTAAVGTRVVSSTGSYEGSWTESNTSSALVSLVAIKAAKIGYEGYERIDGTAGNGSVSTVTIPSGATVGVIFHAMWDAGAPPVTGFTVDGQSATIHHATSMVGNSNTTFVGTVSGFSTGANKTLSWTYTSDEAITEGGYFYVIWFSGASATPVATDEDRQDGAVATVTLNNTATDQVAVVHLCKWGSAGAITTPSGATANVLVDNSSDNSDFSDLTFYTFSTTGSKDYVSDSGQNGLMGALLQPSTGGPTINNVTKTDTELASLVTDNVTAVKPISNVTKTDTELASLVTDNVNATRIGTGVETTVLRTKFGVSSDTYPPSW